MENFSAAHKVAEQDVLANGYDLERQLHIAMRRYQEARIAADLARDEWRAWSVHPSARADQVSGARARFEAVAARCGRIRSVIEHIEEMLDG